MTPLSAMQILRIGASTMLAQERASNVISNNLANANTVGFSRSRVEFSELLKEEMNQDNAGVTVSGIRHIWSQGALNPTGRSLDLAIQGEGFFQIALPDGRTGYTRAGSLNRSADGQITTVDGYKFSPALNIPEDATDYRFTSNGSLMVKRAGQNNWVEAGKVQLATFANPEGLEHYGQGIYIANVASGEAQTGAPGEQGRGRLISEALEDSSVNLGDEMVDLITAQRLYTIGLKVVQTADEMQSLANQLLNR